MKRKIIEINILFYQNLYDSGLSLNDICLQYEEAKYKRYFLQKNLKFRPKGKAQSMALSGNILSDSHKESISHGMKRYFKNNPNEIPYRKYHYSRGRSYPEKRFATALTENKIGGWLQEYQNSIYTYDFAFIKEKINVEIDGKTHLLSHVKKIDERRDEYSKSNGWKVIRFTAKQVNENIDDCIDKLKIMLRKH